MQVKSSHLTSKKDVCKYDTSKMPILLYYHSFTLLLLPFQCHHQRNRHRHRWQVQNQLLRLSLKVAY